jgi:hypothetical protein
MSLANALIPNNYNVYFNTITANVLTVTSLNISILNVRELNALSILADDVDTNTLEATTATINGIISTDIVSSTVNTSILNSSTSINTQIVNTNLVNATGPIYGTSMNGLAGIGTNSVLNPSALFCGSLLSDLNAVDIRAGSPIFSLILNSFSIPNPAYASGYYNIPIDGVYKFTFFVNIQFSVIGNSDGILQAYLHKIGESSAQKLYQIEANLIPGEYTYVIGGTQIQPCLAGEQFWIQLLSFDWNYDTTALFNILAGGTTWSVERI